MKTRPDGPVAARYVGDTGHYDIRVRVYVRSAMGEVLPTREAVENRTANLLLAMPRLDAGAKWDASAVRVLGDDEEEAEQEPFHVRRRRMRLSSRDGDDSHPRFMRKKGQATRKKHYEEPDLP